MLRDRLKQKKNKEQIRRERGKDQSPPIVRSPALESAERRRKGERSARRGLSESGRQQPKRAASARRVTYAAEETLGQPSAPRKSLPRSRVSKAGSDPAAGTPPRTGLTVGWRSLA